MVGLVVRVSSPWSGLRDAHPVVWARPGRSGGQCHSTLSTQRCRPTKPERRQGTENGDHRLARPWRGTMGQPSTEPFQRYLSGVRTALAITVMWLGLMRDLRLICQDFSRAMPRSSGTQAWARARLMVRWVGASSLPGRRLRPVVTCVQARSGRPAFADSDDLVGASGARARQLRRMSFNSLRLSIR